MQFLLSLPSSSHSPHVTIQIKSKVLATDAYFPKEVDTFLFEFSAHYICCSWNKLRKRRETKTKMMQENADNNTNREQYLRELTKHFTGLQKPLKNAKSPATLDELIAELHEVFRSDRVNIEYVNHLMLSYQSNPVEWKKFAKFDRYKWVQWTFRLSSLYTSNSTPMQWSKLNFGHKARQTNLSIYYVLKIKS